MKRAIVTCSLALASVLAFALPSAQDVQSAVQSGNYVQADSMMAEVVAAKPQSAKAHYIYAEILAHEGKFTDAAGQANAARNIDPNIGFTDPAKFRTFQQELDRQQGRSGAAVVMPSHATAPAPAVMHRADSGMPGWVWGLGIALVLFFIFRAVSRRVAGGNNLAPAAYGGNGGSFGSPNPGFGNNGFANNGYGIQPTAGGSMLRTGLAAAGGVAAGMMVERYLEGRHEENPGNFGTAQQGFQDDGSAGAARELENRPIDFGNGGDWGGDTSSDSSGGGSSSSDDGGW